MNKRTNEKGKEKDEKVCQNIKLAWNKIHRQRKMKKVNFFHDYGRKSSNNSIWRNKK